MKRNLLKIAFEVVILSGIIVLSLWTFSTLRAYKNNLDNEAKTNIHGEKY